MKKDSLLINVSRGEVIDQSALVKLLKHEYYYGVILDVFEEEPLSENNPLWSMKNVIISPHVSYASEYRFKRVFDVVYDNLKRYKNRQEIKNKVDLNRGY
jgi:phosphoglycerate dehydrogenase-like enzyme